MPLNHMKASAWEQWLQRGGLKLRHLRVVLEVANARSIGLAARAMNVTQPAVTKSIQEIEAEVGALLFQRTAEGTFPTAVGQSLVRYATEIFGTLDRAGSELKVLASGFHGSVAIGCNFAAAVRLLPEALLEMHVRHPQLQVTVREAPLEVLLPELRVRKLDVLVARWPAEADRNGLVEHARFDQPMAIVSAPDHPLVLRGSATWKDLAACRWLMPPKGSAVRGELDELLRTKAIEVAALPIESASPAANAVIVQRLHAVTIVPAALLASPGASHGLVRINVAIPPRAFSPSSVITLASHELRPFEQALLDCLKAVGQHRSGRLRLPV